MIGQLRLVHSRIAPAVNRQVRCGVRASPWPSDFDFL